MTARLTYVGPRDTRQPATGKVPAAGPLAESWDAAWLTFAALVGITFAALVHAGFDVWHDLRDTYAVIPTPDGPRLIGETR